MPHRRDTADSEPRSTVTGIGGRTRIAVGVAAATIVTAIPTGAIATIAVATV